MGLQPGLGDPTGREKKSILEETDYNWAWHVAYILLVIQYLLRTLCI